MERRIDPDSTPKARWEVARTHVTALNPVSNGFERVNLPGIGWMLTPAGAAIAVHRCCFISHCQMGLHQKYYPWGCVEWSLVPNLCELG